jgi:hypothetical protein
MSVGCRATSSGNHVELHFAVELETPFGSEVKAVGALSELGGWRPMSGFQLQTEADSYPVWTGTLVLPRSGLLGECVEFKFVIVKPDSMADWEEGPNRFVSLVDDSPSLQPPQADPQDGPESQEPQKPGRQLLWEANCTSTDVGDVLLIVGGAPELGAWDTASALQLETAPHIYPRWKGCICLDVSLSLAIEWKLVIKHADGTYEWESGDNRCTDLLRGSGDEALLTVVEFGGACQEPVPCAQVDDWVATPSAPDEPDNFEVAGADISGTCNECSREAGLLGKGWLIPGSLSTSLDTSGFAIAIFSESLRLGTAFPSCRMIFNPFAATCGGKHSSQFS